MFDKALALYATTLATLSTPRSEKGQGTLEYVGIVLVAAILVAAIVGAIRGADIQGTITGWIGNIKSGSAPA